MHLNQPSNLEGQADVVYQDSFNDNDQTYGPSTAVAAPTQARAGIANGSSSAAGVKTPVVYRVYRQNDSAAVINLARGTLGRHFVKRIVSDQTAPDTLVSGTYRYAGVTFSNFPRDMFDHQVTVTGPSAATGEG